MARADEVANQQETEKQRENEPELQGAQPAREEPGVVEIATLREKGTNRLLQWSEAICLHIPFRNIEIGLGGVPMCLGSRGKDHGDREQNPVDEGECPQVSPSLGQERAQGAASQCGREVREESPDQEQDSRETRRIRERDRDKVERRGDPKPGQRRQKILAQAEEVSPPPGGAEDDHPRLQQNGQPKYEGRSEDEAQREGEAKSTPPPGEEIQAAGHECNFKEIRGVRDEEHIPEFFPQRRECVHSQIIHDIVWLDRCGIHALG